MPDPRALWTLLTNRAALSEYLRGWGVWGPAVFIALQTVQVILFVIPGELTGIVGGFLFGTSLGFTYSMVGLTLGTMATFGIGHVLGKRFLFWLLGKARYARLARFTARGGPAAAFVLYVIPGFPKDVLGYVFGASQLSARTFLIVTTLARAPGTWFLTLEGSKAGTRAWGELAVITLVAAIAAFLGYCYRTQILAWVRRRPPR